MFQQHGKVQRESVGAEGDQLGRRGKILVTAARLFRENGYVNTTMTDIARECGLGQSSLYYWYRQKEDILLGLLALNRVALMFADARVQETGSPAVRLLRLLRFDIFELCSSPLDICEVEMLAEQQPDVFAEFWADTAALHRQLETLINNGIKVGEFADCDPAFAAVTICAAEEGVQRRYRFSAAHTLTGTSRFRHQSYSREQVAGDLAAMLVRALLRDPAELPAIIAAAAAYDDLTPTPAGVADAVSTPEPAATRALPAASRMNSTGAPRVARV